MLWTRRLLLSRSLPALIGARAFGGTEPVPKPLRFGVIADPQYADLPPAGTRHYRESLRKLDACIAELNRHELDFTLTLGDLIDRDFASFDAVLARYRALRPSGKVVLGNHDFSVADGDKARVLEKLGLEKGHYRFVEKGWRFVVIDGTEVSTYRYPAADPRTLDAEKRRKELGAAGNPAAQPWNGAIGGAQLEWLARELAEAATAGQRVIVCGHFPLLPDDSHALWDSAEVVALLRRHPHVAAYFCGHNHRGNFVRDGGCDHVNFKGMVETADVTAFAIVTCTADRIAIEGFGSEPSRPAA